MRKSSNERANNQQKTNDEIDDEIDDLEELDGVFVDEKKVQPLGTIIKLETLKLKERYKRICYEQLGPAGKRNDLLESTTYNPFL